jgi:hypothetical protein
MVRLYCGGEYTQPCFCDQQQRLITLIQVVSDFVLNPYPFLDSRAALLKFFALGKQRFEFVWHDLLPEVGLARVFAKKRTPTIPFNTSTLR